MSNRNEVFEYLIGQLRQQVNNNQCEDLAHEVQSLKNQLRDTSALVKELMGTITLMNDDFKRVTNRGGPLPKGVGYVVGRCGPEKSGCHKEDTQECASIPSMASPGVNSAAWKLHDVLAAKGPINGAQFNILKVAFYDAMLVALGKGVANTEQSGCRKEDTQGCEHDWYFYNKGASMMCKKCGSVTHVEGVE